MRPLPSPTDPAAVRATACGGGQSTGDAARRRARTCGPKVAEVPALAAVSPGEGVRSEVAALDSALSLCRVTRDDVGSVPLAEPPATNPNACRRPLRPARSGSGRPTFFHSGGGYRDGFSLCPADLSVPLNSPSAFVRQRSRPAFGEPCDDQGGDLLNSIVWILEPAGELVDPRLQMSRLRAGPAV